MSVKPKFLEKYVPHTMTKRDQAQQRRMLSQSRSNYRVKKYATRKRLVSFKNKPSGHVARACKMYSIDSVAINRNLAKKTGCSIAALKKIVNKGEGAYYSSGSRPNQTAKSWGMARLASAITGQKAAVVDFHILDSGCNHAKPAFKLACKANNTLL